MDHPWGIKHGSNPLIYRQKRKAMEWHHSTSTQKKKFKATPLAGESWPFFWDGEEVILVDMMSHAQTINSDLYTMSPKST